MANCSYGPNGQIVSDAQYNTAVRSKRFVGCLGKFNEVESKEVRADVVINGADVRFYGAVGDGVTDDTQAFVDAIAANACIFVPEGTFRITSTLVLADGKCMTGVKYQSSILSFDTNDTVKLSIVGGGILMRNVTISAVGADLTTSIAIRLLGGFTTFENIATSGTAYGLVIDATVNNTFGIVSVSVLNGRISSEIQALRLVGGISPINVGRISISGGVYSSENPPTAVIETVGSVLEVVISAIIVRANTTAPTQAVLIGANTEQTIVNFLPTVLAEINPITLANTTNNSYWLYNKMNVDGVYRVDDIQVVGAQQTGWTAATGTATRTTFDTTTVTLEQLAERVKALIDDLGVTAGHGLIDA